MNKNPELNVRPQDELEQLHHVNTAGAQLFDFKLFPRKYRHPEYLFLPHKTEPVQFIDKLYLKNPTSHTDIETNPL